MARDKRDGAPFREQPSPAGKKRMRVPARDYDAVVVNPADGTEIALTVMQPALAANEHAPLILHGHGFGGARMRSRSEASIYEQLSGGILPSTEAARRAARNGYFVISFDQRGFGESGGRVNIMDPEMEGTDITAILDWAETEMAYRDHLAYRDGSPVVGALGLSYGGAFQLIGACVDPRFTAIVPTATWYDLTYSLSPDDVVKTAWGVGLVGLGVPTSGVRLDTLLYRALVEGLTSPLSGRGLSKSVADRLYNHSPASFYAGEIARDGERVPADGRRPPKVDALLVQGIGDTLFNLNEAVANARALRAAGNDVQLIGMQYGHSLPFLQDIDRIAYQTETSLDWGAEQIETAALQLAYLDAKLKQKTTAYHLPENCVMLDDGTRIVFDAVPVGAGASGRTFDFEGEATTGGLDLLLGVLRENTLGGLWQMMKGTVANASDIIKNLFAARKQGDQAHGDTAALARFVNALPSDHLDELASGGTFVPLIDIDRDDQAVVGIPKLSVDVTGDASKPVAFLGLGINRPGYATTTLVNKQIRPIRGLGEREIELNGVAQRLRAGDELGLLIYGFHPQFLASFSAIPGRLYVRGRIGLPLIDVPPR